MELHLVDSIAPVGKSKFYVGSTKSYVFYYDSAAKVINAYPEREIKSITIKDLRRGL